jgi:hypothetical protein
MLYWLTLYTTIFSGAVVSGRLCLIFKPHLFFILVVTSLAVYGWWYWQKNYGEVNPSNKEIWLKSGTILVMVLGYGVGYFR